nr:response regulator transcription factor [Rhodovibrio salinarum]
MIDDDVLIQVMVEDVVSQMGHHFECAVDGTGARKALGSGHFDLVILDRRLPDTDGLLLAQTIQQEAKSPFIVLSSLDTANDQVLGLGMGAMDYICKPVEPAVLRARIDKHLAARRDRSEEAVVAVGDALRLNRTTRRLWVGDRVEVLSPAETRLLVSLVENFDQALDRMRLSKAIGGREWVYGDRTVDVLVSRVRRRLRRSGMQIATVYGVGYMLTLDTSP